MVVADPATIRTFIDRTYRADADIDRLVKAFEVGDDQSKAAAIAAEVSLDDQAPIVQLVSRIVSQAMRDRASDIHIEPLDETLRIRFRIDGHLVEAFSLPMSAHTALDQPPQDHERHEHRREARARRTVSSRPMIDGKDVDVRVASVATVFGEKIVMRISRQEPVDDRPDRARLPARDLPALLEDVHSPFGMVICAGPTGAGKTTTLYATLLEINSTGKNVTTVEDPVEYVFPGINQIQTNDQAGLTFATGLKAILRQDPDVILVGEIRDADTARIAVQSALTGHFVLSSLHGTDTVSPRCTASSTWASRPSSSPRRSSASSAQRLAAPDLRQLQGAVHPGRRRARRLPPAQRRQRQDRSSSTAPAATTAPAPATATASACTSCCASRPSSAV